MPHLAPSAVTMSSPWGRSSGSGSCQWPPEVGHLDPHAVRVHLAGDGEDLIPALGVQDRVGGQFAGDEDHVIGDGSVPDVLPDFAADLGHLIRLPAEDLVVLRAAVIAVPCYGRHGTA